MNKYKLLALCISLGVLTSTNFAHSAPVKKAKAPVVSSKQLKGTVADSKAEYINQDWWGRFKDPVLSGYIAKTAAANFDLKIASLKVQESQALWRESLGKEFPVVGLSGDLGRNKTSANVGMGNFTFGSYTQNSFTFPLNVNYEVDLWRKNRDATLGKVKELEAVKYDEKASYISLTSSVASSYFNVINLDKQIALQQDIIKLRKEIHELTKANYNYGLSTATDVTQAEKSLTEAQSAMSDLKKSQSIALNQLAVLCGDSSDNSSELKRASIDEIDLPEHLPDAIKSDVVQQRPDILKSEANLQKAKIDVRLAKKDFLPDITLSGQYGFNATKYEKIFNGSSYIASLGGSFASTLFSAGQRQARIRAKKSVYDQMIQTYQKTILTSFQEVNDALASLKFDSEKNRDNLNRIDHENDNYESINLKYKKGALSYLDTLQYKERVLTLQKEQIQSKTDCFIDSISLYKAVGGKL